MAKGKARERYRSEMRVVHLIDHKKKLAPVNAYENEDLKPAIVVESPNEAARRSATTQ